MGGENDAHFRIRLPQGLKDRLFAAAALPASEFDRRTSASEVVRLLAEPFLAFCEAEGRRPGSFAELAEWQLRRRGKRPG